MEGGGRGKAVCGVGRRGREVSGGKRDSRTVCEGRGEGYGSVWREEGRVGLCGGRKEG